MSKIGNTGGLDPWQYRITKGVGAPILEVGPDMDQVVLKDAEGAPLGTLLGFPIDLSTQTRLTGGTHQVAATLGDDLNSFAETVMAGLAGRYLWLCEAGGQARIYLDVFGQVPCVYDAQLGMAASSAYALLSPEAYDARFDADLHARLGVDGLGWFPGGLTAHHGVQRLLPNHQLDLGDFSVTRHWPLTPVPTIQDPELAVSAIIETVQAQMNALSKGNKKIVQALTAGGETRMLLGCARAHVEEMEFVTVAAGSSTDTIMAARIAAGEGLSHRVLPVVQAEAAARSLYLRRNGECIADLNASIFPSVAPLAEAYVFVGGLGGEVGRAFLWRSGDTETTPIDGAALMGRFGLPPEPRVIAALDEWCAGLELYNSFDVLDLAYVEQRMGPWASAQFPSDPTLQRFAPLLTRDGVSAMMSLPRDWKRQELISAAVVRQTWPELARYPVNTLGPLRDTLAKLVKVVRDPTVVLRKLRKRFG